MKGEEMTHVAKLSFEKPWAFRFVPSSCSVNLLSSISRVDLQHGGVASGLSPSKKS